MIAVLCLASSVFALKPPLIPAWHEGERVIFTVVNDNVVGVDQAALRDRVSNPLYLFGSVGAMLQDDVLSFIPTVAGYKAWWHVVAVIVLDGRDVGTDPFTSEDEILEAEAEGKVLLIETDFVFLCQVLPGSNR
jgi:hypothetical protein